jgi:DNA-binding beta-propeller fold protein YncE
MNETTSSRRVVVGALTVFLCVFTITYASATELLYVGNSAEETVAVIGIPQHEVVRMLHIEGEPDDIVGSSDGHVLYVSTGKAQDPGTSFPDAGTVLAVASDTGKTLWKLPVEGWPHHISLSRDDHRLYVPVFDRQHALVVDTKAHAVISRLHGMWGMHGTRLSADDSRLYAGSMLTSMLFVFDTRTSKLASTIAFPEGVRPFAVTSDQLTAYVQLSKVHGFDVVDLKAGKTVRTVNLPALPAGTRLPDRWPFNVSHGLELSPDDKYLLAAGSIVGSVEVYSQPELRHLKTIKVGEDPNWIVFSSDGRYAYVSCRRAGEISVIDMRSLSELKRIRNVGKGPARMRIVNSVSAS